MVPRSRRGGREIERGVSVRLGSLVKRGFLGMLVRKGQGCEMELELDVKIKSRGWLGIWGGKGIGMEKIWRERGAKG